MAKGTYDAARGRWPSILAHFGVPAELLNSRKNHPCPWCGGTDRFRFTDLNGDGRFICSCCGTGNGFEFLRRLRGWEFREAACEVDAIVGNLPPPRRLAPPDYREALRRVWRVTARVAAEDPVTRYLANRGLAEVAAPTALRTAMTLSYAHDGGEITTHPGMVALVTDANGRATAIHRTYLTEDGHKADVPVPRRALGSMPPGSAVQLFTYTDTLGVCEGIEDALSAYVLFQIPTWACLGTAGLAKWTPPAGVQRVVIFGDNDLKYGGQAAAFAAAHAITTRSPVDVRVRIPRTVKDWNAALQKRSSTTGEE